MTAPEPDSIVWHTSSYSNGSATCVEVGWRTSSYSTNEGDCVEVAPAPDRVLVRDSKDPDGPALAVPTPAWRAFLTTLTPWHWTATSIHIAVQGALQTATSIHIALPRSGGGDGEGAGAAGGGVV